MFASDYALKKPVIGTNIASISEMYDRAAIIPLKKKIKNTRSKFKEYHAEGLE